MAQVFNKQVRQILQNVINQFYGQAVTPQLIKQVEARIESALFMYQTYDNRGFSVTASVGYHGSLNVNIDAPPDSEIWAPDKRSLYKDSLRGLNRSLYADPRTVLYYSQEDADDDLSTAQAFYMF